MAGAVSAGAYTAGVIDYLLETLELWQQAKDKNRKLGEKHPDYDHSVPMHDVLLEVVSGASAGGITGSLAAISLLEGIQVRTDQTYYNPSNKLYDCWVNMADEADQDTFSKLMQDDDLVDGNIKSLLNTDPLHVIANKALTFQQLKAFPKYVASDLDLILTVSNLRGLKYKVKFEYDTGTVITNHGGFFRYRFKNKKLKSGVPPKDDQLFFVLDLEKEEERNGKKRNTHIEYLKTATLSTGAFPIGLEAQKNKIHKDYLERYKTHLFENSEGVTSVEPKLNEDGLFEFDSIDGGLINNEPFGYTMKTLKEKDLNAVEEERFAVIMVNPFPNYEKEELDFEFDNYIGTIAKRMFGALRNQAMFKQDEIINALDDSKGTRFLIAPTRKDAENNKADFPIACGALEGFSGFLDHSFRDHDYALGRKNCQDFLMYWFRVNEKSIEHKFGTEVHPDAKKRFSYHPLINGVFDTQKKFFPIIPDMRVLQASTRTFNIEKYGEQVKLEYRPTFPKINRLVFNKKHKKEILNRIKLVCRNILPNHLLASFLFFLVWWIWLKSAAYNKIESVIFKDLKKHGLLED